MKRIPTRRSIFRRVASALWAACDAYQWIPLLVVLVILAFVNSTWLN